MACYGQGESYLCICVVYLQTRHWLPNERTHFKRGRSDGGVVSPLRCKPTGSEFKSC